MARTLDLSLTVTKNQWGNARTIAVFAFYSGAFRRVTVGAAVRSVSNKDKVAHLLKLTEALPATLTLLAESDHRSGCEWDQERARLCGQGQRLHPTVSFDIILYR